MIATSSLPKNWSISSIGEWCENWDSKRSPINSDERKARMAGKTESELFPYFGATGQVGKIDGFLLEGEYLLIGEDGAPFLDPFRHKAYLVNGKFWVNNHAHILKPEQETRFVCYYLNQFNYSEYVTGTTRLKLTKSALDKIPIPIPPLVEQRRIVAKIEELFSELDKGIENLKQAQKELKIYQQSLLKHAFEGKLTSKWRSDNATSSRAGDEYLASVLKARRLKWEQSQIEKHKSSGKELSANWREKYRDPEPPKLDGLPTLPEGWVWATADQSCTQITDGEHIQPRYKPVGLPMLSAKNVRNGYVDFGDIDLISEEDFEKCLKRCAPKKNDVLIVSVGATTGRAAIVGECKPFTIVRSVLLLRPLISERFLLRWIQSPWCQKHISRASGSTAQAHLYIADTKSIPVPLPCSMEQNTIVSMLEEQLSGVDALLAEIDAGLQKAEALRQSILKKAFAGELVPQDPADEPATVLLARIRAEREAKAATTKSKKTRFAKV